LANECNIMLNNPVAIENSPQMTLSFPSGHTFILSSGLERIKMAYTHLFSISNDVEQSLNEPSLGKSSESVV
jgi:hypothetical protein